VRRSFRRTRFAAVGALIAVGVTWTVTAPGGADLVPGQGNAGGQALQVDPKAGSLSIGVTLGEALAGHQNKTAKAQSQAIDLGAIGTSLTGSSCGGKPTFQPSQLPQTLIVESGDPGAAAGITKSDDGGAFTRFGKASFTPYAEAITTTAPIAIAGVVAIGAATSTAWSGLINGQRTAGVDINVASLTLPGGVSLAALDWHVEFPTGGSGKPSGSFSIGALNTKGAPSANPLSGLSALNALLVPLGLQLTLPSVHMTSGILYVDPLTITVIPNAVRDGLLNTVLTGIQPIRQPLIDAVLKAYCQASTEVTVADVAIGSISGAGSFVLSLGGVHANTGLVGANGFGLGIPGFNLPSLPPSLPLETSPAITSSTPAATGYTPPAPTTTAPTTQAPAPRHTQAAAIQPIRTTKGKRGGALAGVAVAGLGVLALVAEEDHRKMRRAQRLAAVEV
jgi:hypothetical protein